MADETDSSQNVSVEHEKIVVSFPSAISHPSEAAAIHHNRVASLPTDKKPRTATAQPLQQRWISDELEGAQRAFDSRGLSGVIENPAGNIILAEMRKSSAVCTENRSNAAGAGDAGLGDNDKIWNIVQKFENVALAEAAAAAASSASILSGGAGSPGRSNHSSSSTGMLSSGRTVTSRAPIINMPEAVNHAVRPAGRTFDPHGINGKTRNGSASEVSSQGTQTSFPRSQQLSSGNAVVLIKNRTVTLPKLGSNDVVGQHRDADVAEKVHDCVRTCIDQLKSVCMYAEPTVENVFNDSPNSSMVEQPVTNVEINRTRLSLSETQKQAVEAAVEHARENAIINVLNGKDTAAPPAYRANGKPKHHHHQEQRPDGVRPRTHTSKRHHEPQLPNGITLNGKSSNNPQSFHNSTGHTEQAVEQVDGKLHFPEHAVNSVSDAGSSDVADGILFGHALSKAGINLREMADSPKWETVVNHIMVLQGVITAKNKEIHQLKKSAKQSAKYVVDMQRELNAHLVDVGSLSEHIDELKEQLDATESKLGRQVRENRELWNDVMNYRNQAIGFKRRNKSLERRLGQVVNGHSSNGSSSDLYTLPTAPKIDRDQKLEVTKRRSSTPPPPPQPPSPKPLIKEVVVEKYARQEETITDINNMNGGANNTADHRRHRKGRQNLRFWEK